MRIHKLGSRFIRVVTPDRKVHYFSTPGLSSLHVFWIFRNFSNIDDRVLNSRQLRVIQQICSSTEIPRGSVDFESLIGTVELSTAFNPATEKFEAAAVASPVPLESSDPKIVDSQSHRMPSTVVSATLLAACLLIVVTIFANAAVRRQVANAVSHSFKRLASMLPRVPPESSSRQPTPEQSVPQSSVLKVALPARDESNSSNAPVIPASERSGIDASLIGTAEAAELRPATLLVATLSEPRPTPARNLQAQRSPRAEARTPAPAAVPHSPPAHKSAAVASLAPMAEVLPPSGPPSSHPVPGDFPEVSRDTKVILRAIVSADGKVSRVHVLEGNPALAREAVRAVTSWRYSPRDSGGDAESRIVFQFAPDVTTVSFLNVTAPKIAR
ncbi:MAG TPA: TonB family protein [Terriglobales bacterium]|nr:TonB family protein [Terriglobales bacterium]